MLQIAPIILMFEEITTLKSSRLGGIETAIILLVNIKLDSPNFKKLYDRKPKSMSYLGLYYGVFMCKNCLYLGI
jgi:hypothetical protein